MKIETCIDIAKKYLGNKYFNHLNIYYEKNNDAHQLIISRNDNQINIKYGELASLFRGLTLIKEKNKENKYRYELNKNFDTNGLMLDCSRNGVIKNEKVKEMILISSLMGLNRLFLYTEDTLKLDKYPFFGYLRGAYSKEDIKEFVEYAESFGVELVPCIQTLAHLRQTLKWEPMHELRDGEDTLLVDSPKTYEFIEDIIKFCRECFKSKNIHIGMDESVEMGLHKHLTLYGYQDRVEMFTRHLSIVSGICEKYDFSPMIWSDMYFRLNSNNEAYYRDESLPKSTLELIPNNIKLVYWDYYHEDIDSYLKMIKYHKQTGCPLAFAGGAWRWMGFAPGISKSLEFTKQSLNACIQENIRDVFITAWGDDGNECSFFTILPVLAETSIMSFGKYDVNDINSLLFAVTDETLESFCTMDLPNTPAKKILHPMYNPSKYFFYQDILLGLFDDQVKEGFANNYLEFASILKEKAKLSKRYDYIYDNLSKLCDVLAIKVDLGVRLRKAYKKKDKEQLKTILNDINLLPAKIDEFSLSNKNKWMIECRPFGYEVLDGRIGFLKNRVLTAKLRLSDYLEGKIDIIEELEEEILPYDGKKHEVTWLFWDRMVSPSN